MACCIPPFLIPPRQSTVSDGATASRRRRPDPAAAGGGTGAGDHAGARKDRLYQQHASAEEAMAMVVAWTPSVLLPRGGAGQGQEQKEQSVGGGGSNSGGEVRHRVPRTDSQYFFSSRGSSARGMSPAGMYIYTMAFGGFAGVNGLEAVPSAGHKNVIVVLGWYSKVPCQLRVYMLHAMLGRRRSSQRFLFFSSTSAVRLASVFPFPAGSMSHLITSRHITSRHITCITSHFSRNSVSCGKLLSSLSVFPCSGFRQKGTREKQRHSPVFLRGKLTSSIS